MSRDAHEWLSIVEDPSRRRSLTFGDLHRALVSAGAVRLSSKGSHRTYKHGDYRDLVTLVDRGNTPLPIGYVKDVARLLRAVLGEAT
jgi:predicted RNA binding protein YcfA (HicA-like mRNA interferase family)